MKVVTEKFENSSCNLRFALRASRLAEEEFRLKQRPRQARLSSLPDDQGQAQRIVECWGRYQAGVALEEPSHLTKVNNFA